MVWASVARVAILVVSSPSSSSPSSSPGYRFRRIKLVRDCDRWGCNCSESHSKLAMPTKKSSSPTTTTTSGNSELSRYGLDQWDFDLSASSSGKLEQIDAEDGAEAAKRWIAYLISSADSARTYVGITTNMERRLKQHNGELAGGARSGRAGRPWSLLCTVGSFDSRSEASQFEYQWKWRTKTVNGIRKTEQAKDRVVQRRRVALERAIDADPKWKTLTVEWHR